MRATSLRILLALGACGALFTPVARAQPAMPPGLWEMTSQSTSTNPETQKAMANAQAEMAKMSPQQRAMIEKMMADKGVGVSFSGPGAGTTVKMCISKEQAEMRQMPVQEGCTQSVKPSGNTIHTTFSCTHGPVASRGEGHYVFSGNTAYTGDVNVTTVREGKSETMQMKQSGKWLSSDCGAIKPMALPAKAK